MRIFLCGGGCGQQTVDANKKLNEVIDHNKPILYIPLAMPSESYPSCYEWIKDELKEHAVNEALKLSEKYSDTLPKRRSSKQTLLLSKDFLKVMLQENHSAIELLKELFADENTFELYYLPVIEDTASHT